MMLFMIAAIAIMNLLILLLVSSFVVWQWRYRFDVKRVADVMAGDMLERYQEDVTQLNEEGVKKYATQRYIQLAATFGLPTGPADKVASMVWNTINEAQGEQPQRLNAEPLYV